MVVGRGVQDAGRCAHCISGWCGGSGAWLLVNVRLEPEMALVARATPQAESHVHVHVCKVTHSAGWGCPGLVACCHCWPGRGGERDTEERCVVRWLVLG
jgi:hypothetical protein